ncbi:hypothetical protein R3X27_11100 [Tropicimonas sp. TH_r6]|uniref:hypothetical protein n=1 Tax=Tropicimonas sp. TH_r6 TaxID=3082085 RepID=UPI0029544FE4|nr:hypothetical protein [Tropicimonas sp. TH_r6]MDV7143228.1 hypothetical protein [Tropicimonas sp. TH_r6]
MSNSILRVAEDFWNIRGSFRVGGVIDLGTHASLLRRRNGSFLLLDSLTLRDAHRREILELTDGGNAVEAILNLHPFHTLHCHAMHRDFPQAKLYGTRRHATKRPDLPWEPLRCEDPEFPDLFAEDLDIFIPRGVDFISSDEKLHFSSVLAMHRASGVLHVDDTLTVLRPPALLRAFGLRPRVSFHPTLRKVLEPRAGAAAAFRNWAEELADSTEETKTLCAAHVSGPLTPGDGEATISARILSALKRVDPILAAHQAEFG